MSINFHIYYSQVVGYLGIVICIIIIYIIIFFIVIRIIFQITRQIGIKVWQNVMVGGGKEWGGPSFLMKPSGHLNHALLMTFSITFSHIWGSISSITVRIFSLSFLID